MKIAIINGPNLNMLGKREVSVYGDRTFDSYFSDLKAQFADIEFVYFQSNIEGELVNLIQEQAEKCDGIILNAAGYTHSSVPVGDAVAAVGCRVIEVHISNILAREEYRHKSLVAPHASGSLFGFGLDGYRLAVLALRKMISDK